MNFLRETNDLTNSSHTRKSSSPASFNEELSQNCIEVGLFSFSLSLLGVKSVYPTVVPGLVTDEHHARQ